VNVKVKKWQKGSLQQTDSASIFVLQKFWPTPCI